MGSLSYTSGDISRLTPGGAASMADIQGPLTDIRAWANGGVDEINVPNLSAAFTTWKTIAWASGLLNTTGANTYLIPPWLTNAVGTLVGGVSAGWAFAFDPADWLANARTTKLRVRWTLNTNAVAQTGSMTAGLYPVATWAGASGQQPIIGSLGTVVTGSTATFVTPGANSYTPSLSSEFNAPAAGAYIFGVATTALAASSQSIITGHLQMRQV